MDCQHWTVAAKTGRWLEECNFNWISQFGIRFHLALDGLSLALLLLTYFLGIVAILSSWTESGSESVFFHFQPALGAGGHNRCVPG
jgi:NADH-quinone oxidoreductase subunit M